MADHAVTDGTLGATFKEALKQWDAQAAASATRVELEANLERTLRAAWPQTREWKYLCESCRDYGLVMHDCPGDATCGRTFQHRPHDYGVPCWCSRGERFKVKPKSEQDFTAATKVKPPTRFGK